MWTFRWIGRDFTDTNSELSFSFFLLCFCRWGHKWAFILCGCSCGKIFLLSSFMDWRVCYVSLVLRIATEISLLLLGRFSLSEASVSQVFFHSSPHFCMFTRCGRKSTSRSYGFLPSRQETLLACLSPWPAKEHVLCGWWCVWPHWRTVTFPSLPFHLQCMHWFQL